MKTLYIVQHVHELSDGLEDEKLIGVFDRIETAEAAIKELKEKPGFSSSTNGFYIDKYEVNKLHWQDGFDTV
ncbi:MAG: hypothetical protein K6L81_01250 [Agarilytica sp.]